MPIDNLAQGMILGLIFVAIAIIFGVIAVWSILAMNIWGTVIGFVGEGAWIFAGKHLI